jgi:serine/threonine protein kinase
VSTAPLLSPGQVIGQHRVERLLGRGGIAEVYLVTELAFDVQQALKVMIGDDHDWGRRLIREGRAQYLVQHANLVRVFGSLTVQGRPALVMEYVEGTDLHRWLQALRQRGRWPAPSQALELFQGVLAGVGAVHARGLVHRDLKPANILVELTEGGVVPKVTDFGLVKDVVGGSPAGEVTVAGTIMGTQGYIAPEQIWALSEIDARADVFSLGCILYLLLCRKPAFGDVDTSVTFSKVLNEEYTDPREHTPDLLDSLYLAIRYSLVSERARRIPSCEALWEVIQRGRPALEELGLLHEREELPAVAPRWRPWPYPESWSSTCWAPSSPPRRSPRRPSLHPSPPRPLLARSSPRLPGLRLPLLRHAPARRQPAVVARSTGGVWRWSRW